MAATPPNPELAALPNLYLLNPKNRAFVEGRSGQINTDGQIRMYWPLVYILITIYAGLSIYNDQRIADQLAQVGLTSHGVIVDFERTRALVVEFDTLVTSEMWCSITYSFCSQDGTTRQGEQVGCPRDTTLAVGSTVEVTYLASDPNISELRGIYRYNPPVGLLVFYLSVGGVVLTTVQAASYGEPRGSLRAIQDRLRARALSRHGQLLRGENIEVVAQRGVWMIHYCFSTPEGNRIAASRQLKSGDSFMSLKSGVPLAVLYVNDKLYEVL